MNAPPNSGVILLAEDNEDHVFLTREAFTAAQLPYRLERVSDGVELMEFLLQQNKYAGVPRPLLILLDLSMPKKDGREALQEIKQHPELSHIPIIILTTSKNESDLHYARRFGVEDYIQKPVAFLDFVSFMYGLRRYIPEF